jgi:hypothetical protein
MDDVRDEAVDHVERQTLANNNPQDLGLVLVRGKWVI